MQPRNYPKLSIRNKNELSKHISHTGFSQKRALALINKVKENFDSYWKDSKASEPQKEKYVRSAKGTPLDVLLQKVNRRVLIPHDQLLPNFIFGGIKGSNHIKAARFLLGSKRKRVLLAVDISSFFEQVSAKRVHHFFQKKCACTDEAAKLLSNICCVNTGPKENPTREKTLARGFSTSPRLAVWCNLDTFIKLDRLVKKQLKGKDPRIAVYVDDIGITASRVTKEEMDLLSVEVERLLISDQNQKLPLNKKKTKITSHYEGIEHLGLRFFRNKLTIGKKVQSKRDKLKSKLRNCTSHQDRIHIRQKRGALSIYKIQVEKMQK